MRILITGAGGTLGTALAPALTDAGHEPVLFDVQPLQTPYEFVQGDVRKAEDVRVRRRASSSSSIPPPSTASISGTTHRRTSTTSISPAPSTSGRRR